MDEEYVAPTTGIAGARTGFAMGLIAGIPILLAVWAYRGMCDHVKMLKAENFQLHQRNLLLSGGRRGSNGFVIPPSPYPSVTYKKAEK